jgi:putative zinc finger/helix-turn-helix YgiT family protein
VSDRTLKGLCSNCGEEVQFLVVEKDEAVEVRKEPIKVVLRYCRCPKCGDEVLDPNLGEDPFALAYREYRSRHGMLQPEAIREWRKAHDISQNELSRLLGLGMATISRYENGALQDESHEKLLRLAMDAPSLTKLVEESHDVFPAAKRERLLQRLKGVQLESNGNEEVIVIHLGKSVPDEFSGYRRFDVSKLLNAILFFSEESVWKTKLNKLLFYADFKHFQEFTVSITGARYVHVPFGPAPDQFSIYFAALASQCAIELIEEEQGEKIKATRPPDLSLFSPTERHIMQSVREYFDSWWASDISQLSHGEVGYVSTKTGEPISYKYAGRLKLKLHAEEVQDGGEPTT